jgi:hypothetical protein
MPMPVAVLVMVLVFAAIGVALRDPLTETRWSAAKKAGLAMLALLIGGLVMQAAGCDMTPDSDRWTY